MSLERHLMMARAGIHLFPITLLEWQCKREQVLRELDEWIARVCGPSDNPEES
jgi:hypothetical protein